MLHLCICLIKNTVNDSFLEAARRKRSLLHTFSLSLGSLTTRSQEWKSYLVYAEVVNVEKRVANKNACPVVEGRAVVEVTADQWQEGRKSGKADWQLLRQSDSICTDHIDLLAEGVGVPEKYDQRRFFHSCIPSEGVCAMRGCFLIYLSGQFMRVNPKLEKGENIPCAFTPEKN